jgi:5'-nucleotidase
MKILMSNDDGIDAEGLQTLFEMMNKDDDITLVAPEKNCSAMSAALTLHAHLKITQRKKNQYSVNGTPCDSVHLGIHRIMKQKPQMVISGINRGANLGDDVLYSGTVAAAMEGRALGYTSVAISLASEACQHYKTAAKIMKKIKDHIQKMPLSNNIILNINIPDRPYDALKGIRMTRLGNRHRTDTLIAQSNSDGTPYYSFGPPSLPNDNTQGTDFHAIEQGYVSITPLTVDLTHFESLHSLKNWINVEI